MTYEGAFLQAILESPDDDLPRLVYADWLTDQGNPRGEFIHVQCLLAGMTEDDPRRAMLEVRERELLDRHQDEWLGALRPLVRRWTFRRGFLDEVAVPARVYIEHKALPLPATVRHREVDLRGFVASHDVIDFVPDAIARETVFLPLGFRGRTIVVAVGNPHDSNTLEKIRFLLDRPVEPVAAAVEQILEAINRHYGQREPELVGALAVESVCDYEADKADGSSLSTRLVDLLICEAMNLNASQIRIEPDANSLHSAI